MKKSTQMTKELRLDMFTMKIRFVVGTVEENKKYVSNFLNKVTKIGENCTIYQNVTLGRKNKDIAEYPSIGNNVTIYCNSTIVGNIEVGENSIIGCNTVVLKSVEPNSKCVGVVK